MEVKVSVIILAYNEEKGIKKCIESVLPQIDEEDEVIVVSSGSTDRTNEIVSGIEDERIKLIVQKERKGKSSAINLAVSKSSGDIIVQSDGDVVFDKSAIRNILIPFLDERIVAVSGQPAVIVDRRSVFYDWTIMSYRKMHEQRVKESEEGTFWHLCGYLCAFKKEAFENLPNAKGAVDAWMGIILKNKGKIMYAPRAMVEVKAPSTIKDFIVQKARVRAGFLNIKEQIGGMPRTRGSEIKSFIPELLKVKIWRWHRFILSGFIYAYAWWKASRIRKKSLNEIWKVPVSTK